MTTAFRNLLGLLQPWIRVGDDDSAARLPLRLRQGAAFHRDAVQVFVVLFRQVALPKLLHYLVPPLVGAPPSFCQLGDALDRPAPEKVPTVLDERVRALVDSGGRLQAVGNVRDEAALRRRQLEEIAHEDHVDATERSCMPATVQLELVLAALVLPLPLLHAGQNLGADHADLVHDHPPSEADALDESVVGCPLLLKP